MFGKVLFRQLSSIETASIRAGFFIKNRNAVYSRENKVIFIKVIGIKRANFEGKAKIKSILSQVRFKVESHRKKQPVSQTYWIRLKILISHKGAEIAHQRQTWHGSKFLLVSLLFNAII